MRNFSKFEIYMKYQSFYDELLADVNSHFGAIFHFCHRTRSYQRDCGFLFCVTEQKELKLFQFKRKTDIYFC